MEHLKNKKGRPDVEKLEQLRIHARIARKFEAAGYTRKFIANLLEVHPSTITRLLKHDEIPHKN